MERRKTWQTKNVTCNITKRMHRKKVTVTAWAKGNGFSAKTVFRLLHDPAYRGTAGGVGKSIIDALHRDGFVLDSEYSQIPFKKEV